MNRLNLDPKYFMLLTELLQDSSTPQKSLATRVGVTTSKISERKNKLLEMGVIRRFTIDIDYECLGYSTTGFFHISLKEKDAESVEPVVKALIDHPNIVEVHELFGKEHDYLVKIMGESNAEIRDVGGEITKMENVDTAEAYTYPVARTLKSERGVPLSAATRYE